MSYYVAPSTIIVDSETEDEAFPGLPSSVTGKDTKDPTFENSTPVNNSIWY